MIKVERKNGIATIDGVICTFDDKEIRSEIEGMIDANKTFNLPDKYTYEVKPSDFWGKVAKIIYNQELRKELTREERWNWLKAKAREEKWIIPWDRMALPSHEWFDKHLTKWEGTDVFDQKDTKIPVKIPRYRDELKVELSIAIQILTLLYPSPMGPDPDEKMQDAILDVIKCIKEYKEEE